MRSIAFIAGAALFFGCASEGSEQVQVELTRLELEVTQGIAVVDRAFTDPEFTNLGEGVRLVESAVRQLELLETDPASSDAQRLQAILISARAWDDLARLFERAASGATGPLPDVFAEKGMPARFNATAAYDRAADYACRHDLLDHPGLPADLQPCG